MSKRTEPPDDSESAADWRITDQDEYLQGLALRFRRWRTPKPGWDQDHCEFCFAKFTDLDQPDALREGYCTQDGYRWICPTCFQDSRGRFAWTVAPEASPD